MKYIKTVILENFQSHKYSSIDFNEGLNVILGPSDSGKSAIIRGIKWALYNEPSGDYFIREGEREASVTIVFSDNTKLQRVRSKSKNSYILFKKNGEEIKFQGFGTIVPQEIIEEIGIKKIRLDSEESNAINIGEQLEGPFLLSEKNSTRAGAIGRLIGVNVIDDALKEVLRDIRNTSISKKHTEDRITKIRSELKEYEYLNDLEFKLHKVEDLRNIILEKSKKRELLIKCNKIYNALNSEVNLIKKNLYEFRNIERIDPLIQNMENYISSFKYLTIKRIYYIKNNDEIQDCTTLISKLDGLDAVNRIIDKSNIIFKKVNILINNKFKLDTIIKEDNILNDLYSKLDNIPVIEKTISSFEKKPAMISKLIKLRDNYKLNQDNLKTGNSFIKRFDQLEESEILCNEIGLIMNRLSKLQDINNIIKILVSNNNKETNAINKLNEDIRIQLDYYKELLNKVEICPLCLSDIDNNKIEHIISHYN